jgi:hypothetical protein
MSTKCSGCRAEILWRVTPNDKAMPLDVEVLTEPKRGSYVIEDDRHCRPAMPLLDDAGTEYHMNHWTNCPQAATFKIGMGR